MTRHVVVALDRFADAIAKGDERGDIEGRGLWKLSVIVHILQIVAAVARIGHSRTLDRWVEELGWRAIEVTQWRIGTGEWLPADVFVAQMEETR